jgi:hypothetical protein
VSIDGLYSQGSDPVSVVCKGLVFSDCCSKYGYCEDSNRYYREECQETFSSCG